MNIYSDVLNEWLLLHSLEIAESSSLIYYKTANRLKVLLPKYVQEITNYVIQKLFLNFFESGLCENTIITYSKVINMSLKYALSKGYIKENPYKNIIIPRKEKKEIEPFTADEVEKVLSVPMQEWLHDAIVIAYKTGMRKSEIFALKSMDVDFSNKFLMVQRTQSFTKNGVVLKKTKTKTSRRRIDIDPLMLEILKRRTEYNSEFLFKYPDGSMFVPWGISALLKNKCNKAGIKPRCFHNLRHGHATYLLINNVHPKIVQERLGHSNINITLDTYSHLIPGLQSVAVEATEKLEF